MSSFGAKDDFNVMRQMLRAACWSVLFGHLAGCSLLDTDALSQGLGGSSAGVTTSTSGSVASTAGVGGSENQGGSSALSTGGATGQGGTSDQGGAGGAGGEGGGCVPPAYEDVVFASYPKAHFRLEERDGNAVESTDGGHSGTYQLTTSPPGQGGPIELGVPGLVAGGVAVRLPENVGALELGFTPGELYGSAGDFNEFTIELWLDAPASFRGTLLFHDLATKDGASVRLGVEQPLPGQVRPTIELLVHPPGNGAGKGSATVPPEGLTRLHVVAVVTETADSGLSCGFPEVFALYLGGELATATSDFICGIRDIDDSTRPMRFPGEGTAASGSFVLDEIALYDRALSAEEIRAHARAGRGECE